MLNEAVSWAKFFAAHTESFYDDPAYILYVVGTTLVEKKYIGLAVLLLALGITGEETYDKEKHKETVLSSMFAISQIQQNSDLDHD